MDKIQDIQFVRAVYSKIKPKKIFSMNEVLQILKKYPKIIEINKGIIRNEGHSKS